MLHFYHRSRSLLVAFLLCLFIIGYPAFEHYPHFSLSDARLPARTLSPPPPLRKWLLSARLYTPHYRVSFKFTLPSLGPRDDQHLCPARTPPLTNYPRRHSRALPPPSPHFASPSPTLHPHCHPFGFGFLVCFRGSSDLVASPTFSVSFPWLESGQPFTSL